MNKEHDMAQNNPQKVVLSRLIEQIVPAYDEIFLSRVGIINYGFGDIYDILQEIREENAPEVELVEEISELGDKL